MCKEREGKVKVLYVLKRNTKAVKCHLEDENLLNQNFRIAQPVSNNTKSEDQQQSAALQDCVAIPIVSSFDISEEGPWSKYIVEVGEQICPYSTSVLGSNRQVTGSSNKGGDLTLVEQALIETMESSIDSINSMDKQEFLKRIREIGAKSCPKKIEIFGDDRTLVIPPGSFEGESFHSLFSSLLQEGDAAMPEILETLWKNLARAHKSSRIVRRGAIDKESKIRHSGHVLVWPYPSNVKETGPGSPGWITVTEQGIKQSFDMTLVMFSRGNISEKIRFGKLVKEGDFVLDMYAGIGYYTLPALIHGKASHVCACEWNPHAVSALRHNIIDNQVENKVTIFEGDCRTSALEHNLVDMFDRVSLGLLPSSEGGWPTAVRALKRAKGGWLHVHANVPDKEIRTWTDWLLKSLLDIVDREIPQGSDWVVICSHVERVKSFAPTVSHLVADIFVGPPANFGDNGIYIDCHRTGLIRNGTFVPAVDLSNVQVPSCALSPDGALSQSWMR